MSYRIAQQVLLFELLHPELSITSVRSVTGITTCRSVSFTSAQKILPTDTSARHFPPLEFAREFLPIDVNVSSTLQRNIISS